ncbi:hypothetical protein RXV86_12880 [Alisedimentitalea sp. MJ-SS2]|uniref:hypothetical protein n=1 Tax=Aliisedimentitalea sp. MJ-SS2 TaxID=3049795 RepID=UPI00290B9799|nr:hypothetical protein [Alisedimentitalea sp. MJ-SS2]MDU8928283.1 hypothetical protein [Alisedimentitalea sp. MJ-SS2]
MKAKEADSSAKLDSGFSTAASHGPKRNLPSAQSDVVYIIALLVLLLATRPYPGIVHDATLYAAQALKQSDSHELGQDLFFRYGNQGSFTLFGKIHAPLVSAIGLVGANLLLWIAGLGLWISALTRLAQNMLPRRQMAYAAAGFALVLSPGYGNAILSYGENFVTPRLFAESFGMGAMALLWQGKRLMGIAALFFALVLHPLTGLAALTVGSLIVLGTRQRLAIALFGLVIVVALAALGVAPFTWLFQQFDPEWYRLLRLRDSIVFPTGWNFSLAFATVLLPATSLLMSAFVAPPIIARFSMGLLVLAPTLTAISIVGSDILANRLITSLQIWRVLLFLSLFGNMMVVVTFTADRRHLRSRTLIAVAVVFAIVETAYGLVTLGAATIAFGALVAFMFEVTRDRPLKLWHRILVLLPAVWGGALALSIIVLQLISDSSGIGWAEALARLIFIALALMVLLLPERPAAKRPAILAGLLLGGAISIAIIDDRSESEKFVTSSTPIDLQALTMMSGRTVYWEGNLPVQWFKMQVPAYFGCRQKSGILFFRDQAMEFERRAKILRLLNTSDFDENPVARCPDKSVPTAQGPQDWGQIAMVCKALPELGLLVLRTAVENPRVEPFRFTLPIATHRDESTTSYFLYDCGAIRTAFH